MDINGYPKIQAHQCLFVDCHPICAVTTLVKSCGSSLFNTHVGLSENKLPSQLNHVESKFPHVFALQ